MVLAGTRWLGIRLDLLSALLIGAVALFAALQSEHNAGKKIIDTLTFLFSEGSFERIESVDAFLPNSSAAAPSAPLPSSK